MLGVVCVVTMAVGPPASAAPRGNGNWAYPYAQVKVINNTGQPLTLFNTFETNYNTGANTLVDLSNVSFPVDDDGGANAAFSEIIPNGAAEDVTITYESSLGDGQVVLFRYGNSQASYAAVSIAFNGGQDIFCGWAGPNAGWLGMQRNPWITNSCSTTIDQSSGPYSIDGTVTFDAPPAGMSTPASCTVSNPEWANTGNEGLQANIDNTTGQTLNLSSAMTQPVSYGNNPLGPQSGNEGDDGDNAVTAGTARTRTTGPSAPPTPAPTPSATSMTPTSNPIPSSSSSSTTVLTSTSTTTAPTPASVARASSRAPSSLLADLRQPESLPALGSGEQGNLGNPPNWNDQQSPNANSWQWAPDQQIPTKTNSSNFCGWSPTSSYDDGVTGTYLEANYTIGDNPGAGNGGYTVSLYFSVPSSILLTNSASCVVINNNTGNPDTSKYGVDCGIQSGGYWFPTAWATVYET